MVKGSDGQVCPVRTLFFIDQLVEVNYEDPA
jgi:hypothetical protein